jgi:RHS repeat-associated protein
VAEDDTYTVHGFTTIGSILANDYDPDGTALNESVLSLPAHGTLSGASPGYKLYQPQTGYTGEDSFTYQVCDSLNACATATVHLTVTNARPFGVSDAFVVRGYTTLGPLLRNDFDSDNDPLRLGDIQTEQIDRFPQHGTLYGVSNPDIKAYLPGYGYTGTDSFAYNVCDPYGGCTEVSVTLYVFASDGAENAGETSCNSSAGEPVNVTNGNMYLRQTDLDAFLNLTRTYNSSARQAGLFGKGWSSPWDESITSYDGTLYRLNLADGRAVYFAGQGSAFNPVQTDFHAQLVRNGDGTFTMTIKGGEVHRFSAAGKVISVADRNNNQIILTYDGNNNLAFVADPYGRVLTLTTDSVYGYVTSIADAAGTVASYFYGPSLELTRVEYPDGSMYRFGYTYTPQGLVLATVKDALYNVLESHAYDGYGRAITSERHGGAELYTFSYVSDAETHVTDALNRTTKYFFDKSKGRSVVTRVEGPCDCGGAFARTWSYDDSLYVLSRTDGLNQTAIYTYDTVGNLLTATDALGTVTYTYNSRGQALTATDSVGRFLTNTYDAAGNLLTTKDALNHETTLAYDARGRLMSVTDPRSKVTTFAYNAQGDLVSKTDAANGVTAYGYNGRGRPIFVTDALNYQTSIEYDPAGRVKKIISPDNTFVTFAYDLAGRRTRFTDARGNSTAYAYDEAYRLASVTNADNKTASFAYDLMSNLTGMTDALGRTTNYEYDAYDRLVKVIYPPATAGATRLDERYAYNAGGRLTNRIDRAGKVTSYDYDSAGRLAKVTDPALKETRYEYNSRSHLTALVDAINQRYEFGRNASGRLTQVTRGGLTESYTYDAAGNRASKTDFKGAIVAYAYDNLNRLTTISYPNSTQAAFTYDALSHLLAATNEHGTVSFTYDSMGRVAGTTDVFGIISNYAYDQNGNRTGESVGMLPNVPPATVTASYGYDALNRPTVVADGASATVSYGYDAANRLILRALPNGVTTAYEYDGLDRLTRLRDAKGLSVIADGQYQHDGEGRITQKTDLAGTHAYAYDVTGRLTSANHSNAPAETYAYDGVGNRTSSHRAVSYGYQAANKQVSAGGSSFAYDNNGNLTSKTDGAGTTSFTWDYENRLVGAALPSGASVTYKYDALGRRTERRREGTGQWTQFTYEGADVVRDRSSDDSTVEYLNGPGVNNKLRQAGATGTFYFSGDHLNSMGTLTDALGNVVEQSSYDSFGDGAGSTKTRYGFTGRERDPESGLYHYRARWYDPQQGRFLGEDPIRFDGGVNFYTYVGNDPVGKVDPEGLNDAPYYYAPQVPGSPAPAPERGQFESPWIDAFFPSRIPYSEATSSPDMRRIHDIYNVSVFRMTQNGQRHPATSWNALSTDAFLLSSFFSENFGTGIVGTNYLSCYDQASVVVTALKNSGGFTNNWDFSVRCYSPVGFHCWGEGTSNNPAEPKIIFDPWKDAFHSTR